MYNSRLDGIYNTNIMKEKNERNKNRSNENANYFCLIETFLFCPFLCSYKISNTNSEAEEKLA